MISPLVSFDNIRDTINNYYRNGGLHMGLTTGCRKLDALYRLHLGTLHVITGIPSSGKSEWLDQLMLSSIVLHEWHWTVFSPENWPLQHHFQKLAEKWTGKPMFTHYDSAGNPTAARMTVEELNDAISDISPFITMLHPQEQDLNIDALLKLVAKSKQDSDTDAFLLDPWNELEHNRPANMSETEYIGQALTRTRNFGRLNNIAMFLVAHPTKLHKDDNGQYPMPTPYDISGSANWRNKADVCMAVWRDYGDDSNMIKLAVQKIRNKNLGRIGDIELYWNRPNGLFFENASDTHEHDKHGIKRIAEKASDPDGLGVG